MIEEVDESFPPFYISLNIHDKVIHNCLLDSGASHNLIPKAVMDELGLGITDDVGELVLLVESLGHPSKHWDCSICKVHLKGTTQPFTP